MERGSVDRTFASHPNSFVQLRLNPNTTTIFLYLQYFSISGLSQTAETQDPQTNRWCTSVCDPPSTVAEVSWEKLRVQFHALMNLQDSCRPQQDRKSRKTGRPEDRKTIRLFRILKIRPPAPGSGGHIPPRTSSIPTYPSISTNFVTILKFWTVYDLAVTILRCV